MQVIHELRPVFIIGQTVDGRQPRDSVRKVIHLGYEGNYIFPESVHSHVEPKAHDIFDLVADDRIVHVEVRLFPCKYMEIELFPLLAILPGQSLELAEPVVGRQTLSFYSERVTPDIIVAVGIVPAFLALQEPWMLVGCMVYDEIHEDIHSEFMGLVQNFFELLQCTVIGMDVSVVGNVISVVCIRRGIDRGEPDRIHTQRVNVFQFVINAVQISYTVSVPVSETADPDLIEGQASKIYVFFHRFNRSSSAISCDSRYR